MSASDLRRLLEGDLDRLSADVVGLAEINSGSHNPDGVNRCGERLADLLDAVKPDTIGQIPVPATPIITDAGGRGERAVGDAVSATKRPEAPVQICLFGHVDTVFPLDSSFQSVQVDGRTLRGPGVADCKGGLVLAIEVLKHLDRVEWGQHVGWQFLAVPDEEVGSIGSKPLLRAAAERNTFGLGFEPALPSGGVAAARKGTLTGHTIVHGTASHVGRAHADGHSAILELAKLIVELESLNHRSGVTVNCGRISGGGALNVVPDLAIGSFNIRVESEDDRTWAEQSFEQAVGTATSEVELVWTSSRPPKVLDDDLTHMLSTLVEAAEDLGVTMVPENTGGCCDGNDLAAAGLPNIDSLGIRGGSIHSSDEFAHVDSIPERAAVVASLIERITRPPLAGKS